MQLVTLRVEKPDDTHFIKSVEGIHDALVTAVPGLMFGLVFSEASGEFLVTAAGTVHGGVHTVPHRSPPP